MKPRISVLTLAVADLEKSLAFYSDGSGLPSQGIVGREFEHGAASAMKNGPMQPDAKCRAPPQ
jgi:uncharacterized protein